MSDRAPFDPNYFPGILGTSNDGLNTAVVVWANPTNHALFTQFANDAGKTIQSASGQVSSSGDNTLVTAQSARIKVFAFSLTAVTTSSVVCAFQSGAGGGTEIWRVEIQTPANIVGGANLAIQPPAWLFGTASATLLNLNLSSAVAVNYSVSYFVEA